MSIGKIVKANWISALWPSDYRLLRWSAAYQQDAGTTQLAASRS